MTTIEPVETIKTHFAGVGDPRQSGKVDHPLINIIFLTICATLCGADGWVDVEAFGYAQSTWLSEYLDLENGIPSHDTLGRTFSIINPEQFSKGFLDWMNAVSELVEGIIALDGKQLRRSHNKHLGKNAIYMVSAWGTANGVVLGQQKVDEKSNEITAIPKLLAGLNLAGCIVTIDAMGCQTAIAEQIVDQEGDYVLSLKGNQGWLHEDVAEMFTYFKKIDFVDIESDYHKTVNKGHGRIEIRECYTFNPHQWSDYFRSLDKWKGLQSVVMVHSQRHVGDKITNDVRFFISSSPSNAKATLNAVRLHWEIENKLHWVLDIAFREDDSRVRIGHASENMAVIRHMALNLLRQEPTGKGGIRNRRMRCAWDIKYREKVLSHINSIC